MFLQVLSKSLFLKIQNIHQKTMITIAYLFPPSSKSVILIFLVLSSNLGLKLNGKSEKYTEAPNVLHNLCLK